jgi:alpha-2-macroglobulin
MRPVWITFVLGLSLLVAPSVIGKTAPQVSFASAGTSRGAAETINRYTLRFSEQLVTLGDPRAAAPVKIECPVSSSGRWVDGQTYVIDFERVLPGGTKCKIDLREGLKAQNGYYVEGTTHFEIDTGGPSVRAILPTEGEGGIEEEQAFLVATNNLATAQSINANVYCAVDGIGEEIEVDVLGSAVAAKLLHDLGDGDWESRNFLESAGLPKIISTNANDRNAALSTVTALKCRRPLPPGRDVSLVWGAGVTSANGHKSGRVQRFDYSVRAAFSARFECSRVNPQSGCNPVGNAHVHLTAPIPLDQARAIRLNFPAGPKMGPKIDPADDVNATISDLTFTGPFPASVKANLTLPFGLKDESGRLLTNAARFPMEVKFDESPPLVKFAASFGIIEAREGGLLPVTVRAIEAKLEQNVRAINGDMLKVDATDGEVAKWLRDVDTAGDSDFRDESRGKETVSINYTGTRSLLKGAGTAISLSPPGGGKAFEVVGIPLRQPGFYVVELASPILGKALLGRSTTRYVATSALVTNMAVHFKWGREGSLAWVTALDSADPVAKANVRITDSCTGKLIASGSSDAEGRFPVANLPAPETYTGCGDEQRHPLMISARSNGDFSFTLTSWGDGIKPYDFDLPYGWSEKGDIFHTVFDRTLVRQGETVNMKHIMRRPFGGGFSVGPSFRGTLKLVHLGSDTEFAMPLAIGTDGIGETSWTAPKSAPMGDYVLQVVVGETTIFSEQFFKVDEFRLPTMRATISGPREALVRPKKVPLNLFVGYLSGGAAANLPVSLRTAFSGYDSVPNNWEGWSFGGRRVEEGTIPLDRSGDEVEALLPQSQTIPLTLGGDGTALTSLDINQPLDGATSLAIEMDYQDANGETLTARKSIPLLSAGIQVGVKSDGWLMRNNDLRLKFITLDTHDMPVKGKVINVELFSRETLTARRRLIGGFYAYDNQMRTRKLSAHCSTTSDRLGLAGCALNPDMSGEVTVVATTTDSEGNLARAVTTVWLNGEDEWWFGGDNGDRMDVIPEAKSYRAGDTAKFQVRMPFREATALVTVEREGVMSSFVTELSGKDPVIKVPMPGSYAPDVFVSVLAVRGRVGGFKLWTAKLARDWNLPFFSRDGYEPTALVDLAKPSYRLGIAKVKVGWEAFQLGVKVKADRERYGVRETANVDVTVDQPEGKKSKSTEIAFVAVDEALLQLSPNESWNVLEAMMGERPLDVLTSTAQTQVVGKRHYGKKAVEAGGGGGDDASITRTDFKPVLLWKGRVVLDSHGKARVEVPLADSLSSYKLVAIANSGAGLFGTGSTTIRTAQDLTIYSGLPPLVRSGDWYGASFTLKNGTDKAMTVTANVKVTPSLVKGEPLTITLPPGGSAPVTWNLIAPENLKSLTWEVEAKAVGGKANDKVSVNQSVIPAIPVEAWASTLTHVGPNTSIALQAPDGALLNQGYVDVKLSDTLAPPLEGVRAYMATYPYNCFEQQVSRLVVMSDGVGWDKLAEDLPAYLDQDGLLRYWPVASSQGSVELTAYVLSIATEARFKIPDAQRAKMTAAMKSYLNGKLKRESAWENNKGLLRVAALAALARNGEANSVMLGQIGLAPADMPTSTLADWLLALDRIPGANSSQRNQAETILRQRIAYEGSRIDLTDAASAPWWMMSSGDEMALKALLAIMGRPGWAEDEPKMMVGAALRQAQGHWDTTTANAWGTIAAQHFAARHPASAIKGMTTVSLGTESRSQNWPVLSQGPALRFGLPMTKTALMLHQSEGVGPWVSVSLFAAVPIKVPLFAGYRIAKTVSAISQAKRGQWTRGDVVKVRMTVDATAGRNWVVVNDPVPPGATVLGGLGGQSALLEDKANGSEGVWPSYVERGNESWRAYFEWVPEGRFVTEYAMRLNGTGQFKLPPTRVEAMYSPDIRGLFPNAPVTVKMR